MSSNGPTFQAFFKLQTALKIDKIDDAKATENMAKVRVCFN